jgi:hypothetical protein
MKHLKRCNEGFEENEKLLKIKQDNDKIMKDYIKDCFIEFYDRMGEGEEGVFLEDFIDSRHYSIEMSITEPSIRSDNNIDKFIENAKDISEFYEEIKYCIEKVKIKYKDMKVQFRRTNDTNGNFPESYIRIIFKNKE